MFQEVSVRFSYSLSHLILSVDQLRRWRNWRLCRVETGSLSNEWLVSSKIVIAVQSLTSWHHRILLSKPTIVTAECLLAVQCLQRR
jgi:hypothetical protein